MPANTALSGQEGLDCEIYEERCKYFEPQPSPSRQPKGASEIQTRRAPLANPSAHD